MYGKPTIAMVNGHCFGGAFTIVASCDFAIAADEAVFGLSEVNFGPLPAGMVATGEDLAHDPHLLARGFLLDREHPRMGRLRLPGCPVRFRNAATDVWRVGPLLGEDTADALAELLGLSPAEIGAYAGRGALT